MPTEIAWFFVRNILAAWIVNTEFAAPVFLWILAVKSRLRHRATVRFVAPASATLLVAGLVRQVRAELVLPWGGIEPLFDPQGAILGLCDGVYGAALAIGFSLLVAATYDGRQDATADPFGNRE